MIGTDVNITPRKEAETALRESEYRLLIAKAAAGLGIHDWDVHSGIVQWDARTRELWGAQPDETITFETFKAGVHPEDFPAVQAAVDSAHKPGGDGIYYCEYRVVHRTDGQTRWIAATGQTFFREGRPVRLIGTVQDITARKEAEARIASDLRDMTRLNLLGNLLAREGSDVDKSLAAVVDAAIAIAGADKGNVQLLDADSAALTIAAQRGFETPFLKFFEHVRDDAAACAEAMRSGARVIVEDVQDSEIFAGQPSKDVLIDAGVRAVISTPLVSSTGTLLGMISVHFGEPQHPDDRELHLLDLLARQAADFLERERAKEIRETLVGEIQHRSNNLLAIIQAIASRSFSGNCSVAQAKAAFESRLQALARANHQLTTSNWIGADVNEIIRLEMQPFVERVIVDGKRTMISAKHAQNFSLAVHELATNANKHGALSNERGKVAIFWTVSRQGKGNLLKFKWREVGGPPVAVPTHQGFGTVLLKATFPNARIDYAVDGLNCEIDVLLDEYTREVA